MPKSGASSCSKSPDSWKFLSRPPPHPTVLTHTLCFGPWKSPQQGKKRLVFRGLRTGLRAGWEIKDGSAFLFRTLPWERRGPRGEGGGVFRHLNRLQRTRLERSPSSRLHQPHAAERRLPGRAPPRRAATPPLPARLACCLSPGGTGEAAVSGRAASRRGGISRPVCQQPSSPLCEPLPPRRAEPTSAPGLCVSPFPMPAG